MTCHYNFSIFNKSLLFVIEYESNRDIHIRKKISFCTVDHSARYSMKSAAKCEKAMRIAGHIEHE
jgi:hypothetical protein